MKSHDLKYYEWPEVEKFICDELEIDRKYFRSYHKLVGGNYKDLWHVWVSLNDRIQNDSYIVHYINYDGNSCYQFLIDEYGDWVKVLLPVLKKLEEVVGSDRMVVWYCW